MSTPTIRRDWGVIANQIWGPTGYLRGWIGDPLFAHGALGWSGTLVYAVCLRYPAPFSTRELQEFFKGAFSPDQTAYRLRRLRELDIIEKTSSGYQLSPRCQSVIEALRAKFQVRKSRITYSNAQERRRYKASMGRSDVLDGLRQAYKSQPCTRCAKPSDELEHFPPVKWSGEHDWFLTFPICRMCNAKTKRFIQKHEAPPPVTVKVISLGRGNLLRRLEERIESLRNRFYSSVEEGEVDLAARASAKARALFDAHTGKSGAILHRLPSGTYIDLNARNHKFLLEQSIMSTKKPLVDPNLTQISIRKFETSSRRTRRSGA